MSLLPISFAQPLILLGLLALPAIWWLLRMTPPRPAVEIFPPLRILERVIRKEETPHKSPWWLTLLRLLLAAFIILALAQPVYNPHEPIGSKQGALAIVLDNSWAAAPGWQDRIDLATRLMEEARLSGRPIFLALTAERPNEVLGPFNSQTALERLNAARPRPVPVDRAANFSRLAEELKAFPGSEIAYLSDGLASETDEQAFAELLPSAGNLLWVTPERLALAGIVGAENAADRMTVQLIRAPDPTPRNLTVTAFDEQGRPVAEASALFAANETNASADFLQPFELRNDFHRLVIEGEPQAGAVRLLDENSRRRRIGMISAAEGDQAQPLLSSLHYIRRALSPYADLLEPESQVLSEAVPQLLEQSPAILILADIAAIPEETRLQLAQWVDNGGTLVRFAGSRLAAAANADDLLPVRLRSGARALGGSLSWTEPQQLTEFPALGPFHDLETPRDILVRRQVLAEPSPELVERSWASLADGTPLVTGARRGEGMLVLFHVPPEPGWSDLPISGSFVMMLRRIVQLSRNQGGTAPRQDEAGAALAPYRMIAADGTLTAPPPDARPLLAGQAAIPVTIDHPPGLYGSADGHIAHNLLPPDAKLEALKLPGTDLSATRLEYGPDDSRDIKGQMFAAAALMLVLDYLALFWLGGKFSRRAARVFRPATVLAAVAVLVSAFLDPALAQHDDSRPGDEEAIAAIRNTRIAYVVTGSDEIDAVSHAGIVGLNRFLIEKTALEPGPPAGIDIAEDELAFYPLIYWPVDPSVPVPEDSALARIDAYMRQGGTVLFDTRDQYASGFGTAAGASEATLRLRQILARMNVPPLEPVPPDHVLTKAFYILHQFPGRFADAPLWVEASATAADDADRPVRTGDGVSPLMITSADLAGAWAIDASGAPLLPTLPPDPFQRILAYRAGVNIMMYMLTGNYKSDQVHVPILLERLGQ